MTIVAAAEYFDNERSPMRSIRIPSLWGLLSVAVFLGGFAAWGALVPLAGGAVASGVVSPEGSRRTVQHLEGGVIGDILVKDGDLVAAGRPLMTLSQAQPLANVNMLRNRRHALMAIQARLVAEQLQVSVVVFPERLVADPDPKTKEIVAAQELLFQTRLHDHRTRKDILQQRVAQLDKQIEGLHAQIDSQGRQLELVETELTIVEHLVTKGLDRKARLLALQRDQARLGGDTAASEAEVARAQQEIGETRLRLIGVDAERSDEVAKQMDQTRSDLAEVEEKLLAGEDVLKRTVVSAPIDGRIVNLRYKTRSGVIKPGDPILDIVPTDEDLIIEARVRPTDIDVVHDGLPAKIHLSAFAQRYLPQIEGVVVTVSADRLVERSESPNGQAYYLAKIRVDGDHLATLSPGLQLVPGMPVEVLITAEERTLFNYLLKPFQDVLRRAFHEV